MIGNEKNKINKNRKKGKIISQNNHNIHQPVKGLLRVSVIFDEAIDDV